MSKYIVELKPIGSFFFGGEKTMRFDKEEKNNIVQSRKFPQQTSILGMLRKEILVKSKVYKADWNYTRENKNKIFELIGKDSFKIIDKNTKNEQKFGVIESISPVFISLEDINSKQFYVMPMPMDHKKNEIKYTPFKMELECENYYFGLDKCTNIKVPSDFCSKDGISYDFVAIEKEEKNQEEKVISSNEIFKDEKNIGIRLNKQHTTEEDSLFRVNRYKFNDSNYRNIKFVFSVEVSDQIDMDEYRNIVTLGGEGTCFSIYFRKNENLDICKYAEKIFASRGDSERIILLSDTFISKEVYEKYCSYSIATITDFRCLVTKNYKNSDKYYNRLKRSSGKYSLFSKGSVLYAKSLEDLKKLKKEIEENERMRKIGYNQFVIGGKNVKV